MSESNMKSKMNNASFGVVLFLVQVAFFILFGIFSEYDSEADARVYGNSTGNLLNQDINKAGVNQVNEYYHEFQNVHVMMYVGFGFLMVFLKRYGYGAVSFTFMMAAVAVQWGIIVHGFLYSKNGKFYISILSMLNGEFTSATCLISFGAVLGKVSPLQLIVMALIEVPVYQVNEYIGLNYFKAVDLGESMFVHTFGAYFGLCCARVICKKSMLHHPKEGATYHSDLFSMIGTIFLWLYWPSFNGAMGSADSRHRAIINTYLSLMSANLLTFALSHILNKGKINMVHVQNATLAGGVVVGTAADMMLTPWGALLMGASAGIVSTLGYLYLTPFLARHNFHDTCGINNLHGMPGFMAGIYGILFSGIAYFDSYGYNLYKIWSVRAPPPVNGIPFSFTIKDGGLMTISDGLGRSASMQAAWQAAALALTLAMAIVSGTITGFILRLPIFYTQKKKYYFDDRQFFEVPEEGFNERDSGEKYEKQKEKVEGSDNVMTYI